MSKAVISADSTSYPTHAVIFHHDIEDGSDRQLVWALSEAIFRAMRAGQLAALDVNVDDKTLCLADALGARKAHDIFCHLRANHRRSIDFFTVEAKSA